MSLNKEFIPKFLTPNCGPMLSDRVAPRLSGTQCCALTSTQIVHDYYKCSWDACLICLNLRQKGLQSERGYKY